MKLPSLIRLSLTTAGVGLALAALWTKTVSGDSRGYWATDRTQGEMLLCLTVLCAVLVTMAVVLQREWPRVVAAGAGTVLLGLFLWVVAFWAPKLGELGIGAWFGIAGAVLIVLSTAPLSRLAASGRRPRIASGDRSLFAWGVTVIGLGLGIGSLWLNFYEIPAEIKAIKPSFELSYWSFNGDHSTGIVMLVAAVVGVVAALAAATTRVRLFGAWALGASLLFFGLVFFYPVVAAFNNLGRLELGAWLTLAGGVIAVAGAVAALFLGGELTTPAVAERD
jgi:hypothetical protein